MGRGCKLVEREGQGRTVVESSQVLPSKITAKKQKQRVSSKPKPTQEHVNNTKPTTDDAALQTINKSKQGRTLFAALLSCVILVLLVDIVYLTNVWRNQRLKALDLRESKVCVSCQDLKSTEDLTQLPSSMTGSHVASRCCGNASRIVQEMAAKFTEQKYKEESRNKNNFVSFPGCNKDLPVKPAIRVSGISSRTSKGSEPDTPILWNTVSYEVEGLKYLDGFFVVSVAGYYYVSFQVTFDVTSVNTDTPLRASVCKMSTEMSTKREVLLESAKSSCEAEVQKSPVTAAAGSILKFEEMDQIFVTTSASTYLHDSEESHFLSIHKVQ